MLFISEKWSHWLDVVPVLNFSVIGSVEYRNSTERDALHVKIADGEEPDHNLEDFFKQYPAMRRPMRQAVKSLPDNVTSWTYFGMIVCRLVTGITTKPGVIAGAFLERHQSVFFAEGTLQPSQFPMQHIPLSYNGSNGTVEEVCSSNTTKANIRSHMEHGLSVYVYTFALGGWFLFTVLHDWSLLIQRDCQIQRTDHHDLGILLLGAMSFMCLTVTTGAGFSWSSGALSIFVSPIGDGTVCFYHLPHIRAFFALGTPLYLLYSTMAQLQLMAKSFAFGDFLYTERYQLPFEYVASSTSWKEGSSFVDDVHSPRRAGRQVKPLMPTEPILTDLDEDKAKEAQESRRMVHWRRILLWLLDYWFVMIQVLVISPAGMTITKSAVEYAVITLNSQDWVSKIVIGAMCTGPSLMFLGLGSLQLLELLRKCGSCLGCCSSSSEEERDPELTPCSISEFLRPLVMLICWAAGFSFWPVGLLRSPPKVLDLFNAELWGNAGIALFLFGISVVSTNVFSIREPLEELERKEFGLTLEESENYLKEATDLQEDLQKEVEHLADYREQLQERVKKLKAEELEEPEEVCCCSEHAPRERHGKLCCWCVICKGYQIRCSGGWHHELVRLEAQKLSEGLCNSGSAQKEETQDEEAALLRAGGRRNGSQGRALGLDENSE